MRRHKLARPTQCHDTEYTGGISSDPFASLFGVIDLFHLGYWFKNKGR